MYRVSADITHFDGVLAGIVSRNGYDVEVATYDRALHVARWIDGTRAKGELVRKAGSRARYSFVSSARILETDHCCICADPVSTHDDAGARALARCGACNRATCAEHRTEDAAALCLTCAKIGDRTRSHDVEAFKQVLELRELWRTLTGSQQLPTIEHFADAIANGGKLDELVANEIENVIARVGASTFGEADELFARYAAREHGR